MLPPHLFGPTNPSTGGHPKNQTHFFTLFTSGCLALLLGFWSPALQAQANPTLSPQQTIRGTIVDAASRSPLIGVNVVVDGSEPLLGTVTDIDGQFVLPKVPVGRINLNLTYLGYQSRQIPNVVVDAGRETILQLEMTEATTDLEEVVVVAYQGRAEPLNEMAMLSARSISTEEMNRLTASFNDPALITVNYPGVANTGNGSNDIIVRGNSPKYMQWRLEGVPIANPNHFADQNNVLGSTSALNTNLLATSDFYTAAFPAEYGNTLSGVYDIRLRNGNNQQLEGIIGLGLIGTDLTLEGPLKEGYDGSFLVNYRYSISGVLNELGLVEVTGEPSFQDAAFKLHLPTQKAGIFSVFGLGGYSALSFENVTLDDWDTPGHQSMSGEVFEDFDKSSYLLNTGINHSIAIDDKSYLKTSLSMAMEGIDDDLMVKTDSLAEGVPGFVSEIRKANYRLSSTYNRKFSARSSLQVGGIYTSFGQEATQLRRNTIDAPLLTQLSFDERLGNLRTFASWKYRPTEKLTLVAGLHNTNIFFTKEHTIEPRVALRWQTSSAGAVSMGYGLHSSMESVHHYFAQVEGEDGVFSQPNLDLGLLKSHHFVLGYDHQFNKNLLARVEVYYQYLYDLPVENTEGSYFATINEGAELEYRDLVNEGTGQNYGVELSLQRFFANNYYFLVNTSLYESTYKGLDGRERNTRFNGNYLFNFVAGKEFTELGRKRNRTFGVNTRFFLGGGNRIIPLLRDENGELAVDPATNNYWDYDRAFEGGLDNLMQLSLSFSYKVQRARATHELFLNLDNVSNRKGRLTEYYDTSAENNIGYNTQFGLLPNLMYRLYF